MTDAIVLVLLTVLFRAERDVHAVANNARRVDMNHCQIASPRRIISTYDLDKTTSADKAIASPPSSWHSLTWHFITGESRYL